MSVLQRSGISIDATRFERVLQELACIGADPGGGVSRLGLSAAENDARTYLSQVSTQAGLVPQVDPAGNLLVRRPGADPNAPVLLLGSHIDTVLHGGRLDGAYGVVAALEVLSVLAERSDGWTYEPVVAGFANEEGALVQYPFWGSRALAGSLTGAEAASDREGRLASSYLAAAGCDPARLREAAWRPGSIAGYLELHIEQGPVLEERQIPIGIVDWIVGRTIVEIEVKGQSGHGGTTPMPRRGDALIAAASLVLRIESIAAALHACARATVGFLEVLPNTTNTVPGTARLTADMRDHDISRLRNAEALLEEMVADVARERGIEIEVRTAHRSDPVPTHPELQAAIEQAARSRGLDCLAMSSMAGHDAQIVAAMAPVGMIFVPSKDGVSHTPQEDTTMTALIAGAEVLLQTVLTLEHDQRMETRV
jgi:N-carbamoyl-L-amino-acid hydrolase